MTDYKQAFIIINDINMSRGEIAAQVAHGSMISYIQQTKKNSKFDIMFKNWVKCNHNKIILKCNSSDIVEIKRDCFNYNLYFVEIYDIFKTSYYCVEEHLTGIVIGPDQSEKIDYVTKKFKLL